MSHNYLDEAIARQIVQRTMSIIGHSVNVMDKNGVIIASGDPARIYQRHEGAILALTENRLLEVDEAMAKRLKGVKPGINIPIFLNDEVQGVIGISGPPDEVISYAKLVKMAAELILEQALLLGQKQWDRRYQEQLMHLLISNQMLNDSKNLQALAAYLDFDLSLPRVVLIIELNAPKTDRLRTVVEYFEKHHPDFLVNLNNFNQLLVLKPIRLHKKVWNLEQEKMVLEQIKSDLADNLILRINVGGYFAGIENLYRSYLTAKATQEMAARMQSSEVYLFYAQNALPALLSQFSQNWQAKELLNTWEILAAQDKNKHLQATLKHFLNHNCDLARTAQSLGLHVNSVRYRINRIEQITNIKLNELNGILWLYLGLYLQK